MHPFPVCLRVVLTFVVTLALSNISASAQTPTLVKDILPGLTPFSSEPRFAGRSALDPCPRSFLKLGKLCFFSARDKHGYELWRSDGTSSGTFMLLDINPGPANSWPGELKRFGSSLLFQAISASAGRELWITDGSKSGTRLVRDLEAGPGSSSPTSFVPGRSGFILFAAKGGIWETDGTSSGTRLVVQRDARNLHPVASKPGTVVFLSLDRSFGIELWISDGTSSGTKLLKDIRPGAWSSNILGFRTLSNGDIVFPANDGVHGQELWVTDGTSAGTKLLKDIRRGSGDGISRFGFAPDVVGQASYFTANDGIHGSEPWSSDGTPSGTILLKDINPGSRGSNASHFVPWGAKAVFLALGPQGGRVWCTRGTAASTRELDVLPPSARAAGDLLAGPQGLYFGAASSANS